MEQLTPKHFAQRLAALAKEMEIAPPQPNGTSLLEDAAKITQTCATLLSDHDPNHALQEIAYNCERYSLLQKPALPIVGDPCVYYTQAPNTPNIVQP